MQFRLRTLFVAVTCAAWFTLPCYEWVLAVLEEPETESPVVKTEGTTFQLPELEVTSVTTVVRVPDGGTVFYSGIKPRFFSDSARE